MNLEIGLFAAGVLDIVDENLYPTLEHYLLKQLGVDLYIHTQFHVAAAGKKENQQFEVEEDLVHEYAGCW